MRRFIAQSEITIIEASEAWFFQAHFHRDDVEAGLMDEVTDWLAENGIAWTPPFGQSIEAHHPLIYADVTKAQAIAFRLRFF